MKSVFLLKKAKERIGNFGTKRLALIAALLVVSAVSLIGYFVTAPKHANDVRAPIAQSQSSSKAQSEPKPVSNQAQSEPGQSSAGTNRQPTKPSNGGVAPAQSAGNTSQQPPQSSISVNVTVAGNSSFSLTLPFASNQCDVLSHALGAGKISQLDMRYNSGYGSYGVYKINNIGQSNQIWWTFRVNGVSPAKGCSYVTASNYDQIVWEYIGP